MKTVIDVLKTRSSEVDFSSKKIRDALIKDILKYAQRSASTHNAQDVSIIYVTDENKIDKLAKICGNIPQVSKAPCILVFVADYNRPGAASKTVRFTDELGSLLSASIDVGIVAQSVELIAQSLELSTVMVECIRKHMSLTAKVLNITGNAYPLLAMAIGYNKIEQTEVKPRVELNSFIQKDKYNILEVKRGALRYDLTLRNWYDDQDLKRISYLYTMNHYLNTGYVTNELEEFHKLGVLKNITRK